MTFKIYKASDCRFEEHVEVNSLEDLANLAEKYGSRLIVDFWGWGGPIITIYDDYVE